MDQWSVYIFISHILTPPLHNLLSPSLPPRPHIAQDSPCRLKTASNDAQCCQLLREKEIFEIIRARDRLQHGIQYLVGWLHPQVLRHDEEEIYYPNDAGEMVPQASPMCGLVFESGGATLGDYIAEHHLGLSVIQSVHILEQIVKAVSFLHRMRVVHFDIKPENIVCFSDGHQTRWKLIDFDSSYDENSNPRPIITSVSGECRLTEEFIAPEVIRVFHDPSTSSAPLEITSKVDIWSLGMVAVLLFTGHSLWKLLYKNRPFNSAMLLDLTQSDIQYILGTYLRAKQKSFVEACLQIDPSQRVSADGLLRQQLITVKTSTIHAQNLPNVVALDNKLDNLSKLLTRYKDHDKSLTCEVLETLLDGKLSELFEVLTNELNRIERNQSL